MGSLRPRKGLIPTSPDHLSRLLIGASTLLVLKKNLWGPRAWSRVELYAIHATLKNQLKRDPIVCDHAQLHIPLFLVIERSIWSISISTFHHRLKPASEAVFLASARFEASIPCEDTSYEPALQLNCRPSCGQGVHAQTVSSSQDVLRTPISLCSDQEGGIIAESTVVPLPDTHQVTDWHGLAVVICANRVEVRGCARISTMRKKCYL